GGQLNPAVAIGLVVAGKQKPGQAAAFIVMQLLGSAAAAAIILAVLTPAIANNADAKAGATNLGATIGILTTSGFTFAVIAIEALLTFALMFAVLMSVVDD